MQKLSKLALIQSFNLQMDIKQADKKFKKGKENITVGVFNWSKDYASAASNFDEAFKIYKSCGAWQKAINTLKQLIVCNQKMVDSWAVARNYDSLLDIYMQKSPVDFQTLRKTTADCFIQYRMAESLDKGLQMVAKVTKHLKSQGKTKQGIEILHQAYKIALEDDKSFKKKQVFGIIIQNFLENELYDEAIKMYYDNIKTKNGVDCDEQVLIVVILYLIMGEPKRAEQQMYELSNSVPTFLTSNQAESAQNLIKAYKAGQEQAFKKQTTKAAVTTLFPLIIIKKLRAVKVPSAQAFQSASEQQKQQLINEKLF